MADLSMIVRMVIYKCRELSNPVTETLAAYVAQTTLNPRKYFKSLTNAPILSIQRRDASTWRTRSQRTKPKNSSISPSTACSSSSSHLSVSFLSHASESTLALLTTCFPLSFRHHQAADRIRLRLCEARGAETAEHHEPVARVEPPHR